MPLLSPPLPVLPTSPTFRGRVRDPEGELLQARRQELMHPKEPDRDEAACARRLSELERVDREIADYNRKEMIACLGVSCLVVCVVMSISVYVALVGVKS